MLVSGICQKNTGFEIRQISLACRRLGKFVQSLNQYFLANTTYKHGIFLYNHPSPELTEHNTHKNGREIPRVTAILYFITRCVEWWFRCMTRLISD